MSLYLKNFALFVWKLPRNMLILIIKIYQKTISPDHGFLRVLFPGGYCRFTPSCSDYSKAVIKKHGFLKGALKAIYRIMRCNPFNKGGIDLPK